MTVATHDGPPDAVRIANAHFYGGENCIGRRLLEDPNMGQVWQTLMREGRGHIPKDFEDRLNSLHRDYRMETWVETWDAPMCDVLAERACASFFLATAITFSRKNPAVAESKLKSEVKRWRDGAALCREALEEIDVARGDPKTAQGLETSAAYFEKWAEVLTNSNMNSPYLVKRKSRGRDHIRGQVRDVAAVTRKIYGSFMCGTVATTASAATGLDISLKDVEDWAIRA
jgi:hypothetical protein